MMPSCYEGCLENRLYVLQGSTVIDSVSAVQDNADKSFFLWHKKLGHVSERGFARTWKNKGC